MSEERIRELEGNIGQVKRDLDDLRNRYLQSFRAEIDRLESLLRIQEDELRSLRWLNQERPKAPTLPRASFEIAPVKPATPTPIPPSPPPPRPRPAPAPAPTTTITARAAIAKEVKKQGWEAFFGEKVLSRVGLVVLLFGIVFLIGYKISTGTKWAKLLAGGVTGIGLVATGVTLRRKEAFRQFALPVIGAGWAIFFFTVFAASHIHQVQVIQNPFISSLLMMGVASGMIAHSLAYRSQAFTGFSYALAYLAILTVEMIVAAEGESGRLGTATLYAMLVLAGSLGVIRWRSQWRGLMTFGMAATYLVAIFWMALHPEGLGARGAPGPLLAAALAPLALFVAVFKATEWLSRKTDLVEAAVQSANLLIGTLVFSLALGRVYPGSMYFGFAAAAAMNALFAWRLRKIPTQGVFEAGSILTIALTALAIGNAFADRPESIAVGWLIEAQVVLTVGLLLCRPLFRRLAAALFAGSLVPLVLAPDAALSTALLACGAAVANSLLLRRFAGVEAVPWQIAAGLVLLRALWGDPQDIAVGGLVYAEVLTALGLWLGARETRWTSIGAFIGAGVAYGFAAATGGPPFALLLAFMIAPLANTIALRLRGGDGIAPVEHAPWHLVAMGAALCHFDQEPKALFLTWLIQGEVLLGLATTLRLTPIRVLAHACFITAGFALIQAAGTGTFPLYLLYGGVGIANTVLAKRVRPDESVGDAEPLVWHLPVALLPYYVFDGDAYRMCAAGLIQAEIMLGLALLTGSRALRAAQPAVFVAAAAALAAASRLFSIPDAECAIALSIMTALCYVNAQAFKSREAYRYGGAAALALLVWNAFDLSVISMLWGAAALTLWEIGRAREDSHFRLQGNLLVTLAASYLFFIEFDAKWMQAAAYLLTAFYAAYLYARQIGAQGLPRLDDALSRWNPALSWIASALVAFWLFLQFDRPNLAPAWNLLAAALLAAGLIFDLRPLRQQASVLVGFAFVDAIMTGLTPELGATWGCLAVTGALQLGMGVLAHRRFETRTLLDRAERTLPYVYTFAGAILLAFMSEREFDRHLLTIAWGAEGLLLVVAGLLTRQSVLRYPGLAMLVWCIGKIVVDLWALRLEFRILAFIGLGLVLLAASFAYARFRQSIKPKETAS